MSEFIPSEEQRPAIEDREQDILVSASAGSGKTAVLVQRVLGLLAKDHLNIDQLLMVTFTKEAAKNMRERLRKKNY
ncbi:UvrD-helicase domain-containing protein [Limosilactobacillus equigenerosi]|uniref:UvrD-helicase domain-containing protein n=1 Tax=Limosilactobacillus equigenerosi TaxID=417373 RepID=UPI0006D17865